MGEAVSAMSGARQGEEAYKPYWISPFHCWICMSGGAVVGVAVIAAVILYVMSQFN